MIYIKKYFFSIMNDFVLLFLVFSIESLNGTPLFAVDPDSQPTNELKTEIEKKDLSNNALLEEIRIDLLKKAFCYIEEKYKQSNIPLEMSPNKDNFLEELSFLKKNEALLQENHFYFKDQTIHGLTFGFDVYIRPQEEGQAKQIIFFPNFKQPLNRGSSKERYFGINELTGEVVAKLAIKKINDQKLMHELRYLNLLQGPGIVSPMTCFKSPTGSSVLIQRNYECDLFSFLHRYLLNDCQKFQLFYDTLIGIKRIHSQGLVHRDIKSENILIYKEEPGFRAAICDMEYIFNLRTYEGPSGLVGTSEFFSPEVIRDKRNDLHCLSDIWSAAIILLEIYGYDLDTIIFKNRDFLNKIKKIYYFIDIDRIFNLNCVYFMRYLYPARMTKKMEERFETLDELVCGMLHPSPIFRVDSEAALKAMNLMGIKGRFGMNTPGQSEAINGRDPVR